MTTGRNSAVRTAKSFNLGHNTETNWEISQKKIIRRIRTLVYQRTAERPQGAKET